ncbi:sulfur carrier protein ThiS [Thermoleophilia bacterium SCSIO 60948]|nr:sulfur carrier protein ThiS [Thermoleophilia bacterium SCSIO 60948]
MIAVELNGTPTPLDEPASVADAVRALGADSERGVAVALGGEVVPRARWDETALADGDTLEVVRAVQGG